MLVFRSVSGPEVCRSLKDRSCSALPPIVQWPAADLQITSDVCGKFSISMGNPQDMPSLQVDKNPGSAPVPAYVQAYNSQITNNVATSQGGGINAATSDGIVLVNTDLSGNFGESLAYPPCFACRRRCRMSLLQATDISAI